MTGIWNDIKYSVRMLHKKPSTTIFAILILAIGIGATTAIFSVVQAVLLQSYPYKDVERLVQLWETNPAKGWTMAPVAPANYLDWEKQNNVFEGMAAYIGSAGTDVKGAGYFNLSLAFQGKALPVRVLPVSGSIFRVLGTVPLYGRIFRDEEMYAGNQRIVVLSYSFWKSALGGDPQIVGKAITLNKRPYVVAGIMPAQFYFPNREAQMWIPFGWDRGDIDRMRVPHFLRAIARLKRGVSIQQARTEMKTIAARLEHQYPQSNSQMGVGLSQFHEFFISDVRLSLEVLSAAVLFVLLVGCANLANLILVHYNSRSKEISVRLALGAGRVRLLRQLLIESLLLSIAGASLGLLFAVWARDVLIHFSPGDIPRFEQIQFNAAVLLFAIFLAIITPILFGLFPAIESLRHSVSGSLKESTSMGGVHRKFARNILLITEVSLSLLLLFGAGLLLKSFIRLESVNPGFDPQSVLTFEVSLPAMKYSEGDAASRYFQELLRRLHGLPHVQAAAATTALPLRDLGWSSDLTVEQQANSQYVSEIYHKEISPDYFRAMKIPFLRGRSFSDRDTQTSDRVVIVNESFARRFFQGADAIGHRIKVGKIEASGKWSTIIGICADEKQNNLAIEAESRIYESFLQSPQGEMTLILRTDNMSPSLLPDIRNVLKSLDQDIAPFGIISMKEVVEKSVARERFLAFLLCAFAFVACFLAGIGIYSVVSYLVSQRTREMGIRIALGARRSDILQMVLSENMRPVVAGLLFGTTASFIFSHVLRSMLFRISPTDPATLMELALFLFVIGLFACIVPASAVSKTNAMIALRYE